MDRAGPKLAQSRESFYRWLAWRELRSAPAKPERTVPPWKSFYEWVCVQEWAGAHRLLGRPVRHCADCGDPFDCNDITQGTRYRCDDCAFLWWAARLGFAGYGDGRGSVVRLARRINRKERGS